MQLPFTTSSELGQPSIRVLHCIPTLAAGGAETQLRLLAPRIVARGVGVAIFSRVSRDDVAILTGQGVVCFPLHSRGNYNPVMLATLWNAIRAFRPSIIQTWLPQMDIVGGAMARISGVQQIISERSSPPAYATGVKSSLRHFFGRNAMVVANTSYGLDVWPHHDDAMVIGNGIDFSRVASIPKGSLKHVEPFRDRTTVVTISRLVPEKGVEIVIEAIDIARRSVPNLRLIVVGDGPERQRLATMVTEKNLGDHVVFEGLRGDPIAYLRSADMFVSASLFEGHPNALTEAAAAGVPAILSDIPMHRSLMGGAALYVSRDDAAAFATRMVALARSRDRGDAMASKARNAIECFGADAISDLYVDLYQRVAENGSAC